MVPTHFWKKTDSFLIKAKKEVDSKVIADLLDPMSAVFVSLTCGWRHHYYVLSTYHLTPKYANYELTQVLIKDSNDRY